MRFLDILYLRILLNFFNVLDIEICKVTLFEAIEVRSL